MKWLLLAVFVFSASSIAEQSKENRCDGNHLLPECRTAIDFADHNIVNTFENGYNTGYCMGLVTGIADGLRVMCVPDDVTYTQMERVVFKYLNDHPNQLHLWESLLVTQALVQAFPCPTKK